LDSDAQLDEAFMDVALRLGDLGWGRTYPNPMVGAVVVRDGAVIGEGWHAEYGDRHAEVVAISKAGNGARGGTLYVTLEPCSHVGKQPPCVDAIIAAGIRRVVVAARDPDPIAAGGADRLRAAGITVDVGCYGQRALGRNFRFMRRFAKVNRPFVAIKLAVSMDGKIADGAGHSRWVSSESSRRWVHWLRAGFGSIAVGATTAIVDDAHLTVRGELQPRVPPVRIVFDRRGRLPLQHSLFKDAESIPLLIVSGTKAAHARRAEWEDGHARVVVADAMPDALQALSSDGIDSILVEGGGRLAGALMRDNLVDRVYQIQCPLWLGDGKPAWDDLGSPAIESATRWQLRNLFIVAEPKQSGDILIELEPG
jgi:diaminohydroxyphosphoribosylaminopyrimidine deaminase/5-amino-6-(5-phosphoribosylamino)uracil reductase